jgi:hydroxypyruvate isomerase
MGLQMSSPTRWAYAANCSLLFQEVPILERPAAARAAGFDSIEFWWPFETAVPTEAEIDGFVTAVQDAGVQLIGLNYFAGDLFGPDCGVLSIPGREQEFLDSVRVATGIGARLGVGAFNALYGNRVSTATPEAQDELAIENLSIAADAAASIGAVVLIEAVSGPKPYPLRTADDAVAVVEKVVAAGHPNFGFLCDLYHLAANDDDVDRAIERYSSVIAHVQIADLPGRGEPGSGSLDLRGYLDRLAQHDYSGRVALEYKPSSGDTEASLERLAEVLPNSVSSTKDAQS